MDNEIIDPLKALRQAVVSQKAAALPDHPEPGLQDLHGKMVEYDRYVSETVIAVLGGGSEARPYPRENELVTAFERPNAARPAQIERYRKYKERLDHMLTLAIQVAAARQG